MSPFFLGSQLSPTTRTECAIPPHNMPLAEITNSQLNSQELDSAPRKRTIAEFFVERKSDDAVCNNSARGAGSPTKSSPGLTASGSSPLERNSPSPNVTPKRLASQELLKDAQKLPASEPPAKRKKTTKKATPEEVAAKAAAEEAKKKEKEAKDAARLAVEEAKKKEKEEKEAAKEAAKAEKEAIKIKKAEEAKKAAEERERKRLEKEAKKLGLLPNQKKLTDMFGMGPSTPKKSQPVVKAEIAEDVAMTGTPGSPAMENVSYRKRFQPFFVKEHVTLASYPYEMDEETREAKSRILCEYVDGERQIKAASLSENVLDLLQIPSRHRRGRVYPSVRSIMTKYHGNTSSNAIDLTSESQKTKQITHTLEALKAVPVKSLKFREDVRPPYIGTISGLPPGVKSLKVIARHPTARVTALNYDYDSEGEWQEDDGEDVEDLDDDEEDADADEEMEDFLDDSEDVGPARLVFSGGMEPENTGLCWESRKRLNSPARLYKFRMEFILGKPLLKRSLMQNENMSTNLSGRITSTSPQRRPIFRFVLEACRQRNNHGSCI